MLSVNHINNYKTHQPNFSANHKILIADDHDMTRQMLQWALEDLQPAGDTFEIRQSATVEEAQKELSEHKPDIFFSDGHIDRTSQKPENADGIKLSNIAKEKGIQGICVSSGDNAVIKVAKEKGFEVLPKGYGYDELEKILLGLLKKLNKKI